jgi:hypothetical protein
MTTTTVNTRITMTDRPSPTGLRRAPARRPNLRLPGLKALVAAASLTVTLGGWAAIAAQSQPAPSTGTKAQPVAAPLPTLVPLMEAPARPGQPSSGLGAPSNLRSVQAPRPVARTQSSR